MPACQLYDLWLPPLFASNISDLYTSQPHCQTNRLETLLLNLRLSSRDGSIGIGVREAAALLAVLLRRGNSRANALCGVVDLGAASGLAVGVSDTSAGDELGAVSAANVLGAGVVGG